MARIEGPEPEILVIAGVNGAGKSSVAGKALRAQGATYFNPDEVTRAYLDGGLALPDANARAWQSGRRRLEEAIAEGSDFAFETTLGGRTITALLMKAATKGIDVRVFYVGLASADLHVERVRQRVARGGHDIPEQKIRSRWSSSRENLIRLLPHLAELVLFDNSRPADPQSGHTPEPLRVLHVRRSSVIHTCVPDQVPQWAKPVTVAALFHQVRKGRA